MGFKIGGTLGKLWDRNVKRPIVAGGKSIGKPISKRIRGFTDTVGLTTPKLPADSLPQLDPAKLQELADYKAQNDARLQQYQGQGENILPANRPPRGYPAPGKLVSPPRGPYSRAFGGPGYFNPETYNPVMPTEVKNPGKFNPGTFTPDMGKTIPVPIGQKEQNLNYAGQQPSGVPTEGSIDNRTLNGLAGQFAAIPGATQAPQLGMIGGAPDVQSPKQADPLSLQRDASQINLQRQGTDLGLQKDTTGLNLRGDTSRLNLQRDNTTLPGQVLQGGVTPQLSMEGQQGLGLGKVSGLAPDLNPYQTAVQRAMNERINTGAITQQGFDPQQEAMAIQNATAGIDQQKSEALAQMKEQFSKTGMWGSSVAQAEMAKLGQRYDQQKQTATNNIRIQGLSAARQDRYTNAADAANRMNQISSLASQGQGLATQGASLKANFTAADNSAIQADAANLMNQRGIDRNTAMQLATFNRQGQQADEANALNRAQFAREGMNINNQATAAEAQFGREGTAINNQVAAQGAQFAREGNAINNQITSQNAQFANAGVAANNQAAINEAQFGREGTNINNQATAAEAQFNQAAGQQTFQNATQIEDLRRQGILSDNQAKTALAQFNQQQQDINYARNAAQSTEAFGRGTTMADIGQRGRAIDRATADALAANNFNRNMAIQEFNRQGRGINTAQDQMAYNQQQAEMIRRSNLANYAQEANLGAQERAYQTDWQRYNAEALDAAGRADLQNQAMVANINARDIGKQREYADYQDILNRQRELTSGSLYTPQSVAASNAAMMAQLLKQQRLGTFVNLAGKFAKS